MSEYAGKAPLYIIEVYPWRRYKGNSDPVLAAQWIDFAEEFQLYFNYQDGTNQIPEVTIDNYASYGDSGKIPTLQVWKNGALVDMVVYYNDRFSGTTWPKTISGSYYSDGPIGQTFATDAEYTSSATILAFYNNKIKTFLQQYLR